jgi:hypothetical protein
MFNSLLPLYLSYRFRYVEKTVPQPYLSYTPPGIVLFLFLTYHLHFLPSYSNKDSHFYLGLLRPLSSHLCFLNSWDDRHMSPHPAFIG